MKKDKILLILVAVFAVLFIAAYFLYGHLSDRVAGVDGGTMQEEPASEEQTEGAEETAPTENEKPAESVEQKQYVLAPDFTVYDVDGNPVKLSDFRGKPVVLSFWASWCSSCTAGMPIVEEAYSIYGEDVHFVMVNLTGGKETAESAKGLMTESGYTFPYYLDTERSAAGAYGVYAIPVTFYIDREGYAIAQANGPISANIMNQGLERIINR